MATTQYDTDLDKNPANFQPLTPLSFLQRAAAVFPDQLAIVHGSHRWSYPPTGHGPRCGARPVRHTSSGCRPG